jgi:transcriptional regulator with XRE-family HTH domain
MRAAIARAGGFHRSYVTRILSGARSPSPRFFEALSSALRTMAIQSELEMVRMIEGEAHASREIAEEGQR